MRKLTNLLEAFEARYIPEPNSGCWLWIGKIDSSGYGQVNWAVLGGGLHQVHRLSWKLFRGPLDDRDLVCHHCDVRCCVNPDHLFIGDNQINMDDMVAKDRQRKGENAGMAKISEEQAIAIICDSRTQYEIARDYSIDPSTVSSIKRGEIWKHLGIYRLGVIKEDHKVRGEKYVKLTESQAVAIICDTRTQYEIARDYGIDPSTVGRIKRGRNWKHLDAYRNLQDVIKLPS
jgi:DNA-binding CsgD family transcriptional regulator